MFSRQSTRPAGINTLLTDQRVRRSILDTRPVYAAVDIVGVLADAQDPVELWNDLKDREPALADLVVVCDFLGVEGSMQILEALDLDGVLRLVQSISSPKAERIKNWLARSARERLEEAENPELAILRTRRAYEQHGYSRRWIDQRLRSVSARHELTGEWYRRGVRSSDEFRTLTNELMRAAFGMDVESYRRYKGLYRTGENLRDHMTDLELALSSLGETTAAVLHRDRHTSGFDALVEDARASGSIIAKTRRDIERQAGRSVVSAANHLPSNPRPPHRPSSEAQERRVAPLDAVKNAAA